MAARRLFGKLRRDDRGAVAVEYGLLAVLAVIAVVLAITTVGKTNLDVWTNVASKIIAAT